MGQSALVGQIVILNGAPRCGKSSIAAVVQETFAGVWMNLGVDWFKQIAPSATSPGSVCGQVGYPLLWRTS